MDIFQSVQGYINKIVSQGETASSNNGAAKMKILLLDKDTVCDLICTSRSFSSSSC